VKRPLLIASPLLAALIATASTGCRARAETDAQKPALMRVGPENVITVKRDTIIVGPIVSGELRAEHQATVRAEVGGSVLDVTVDEGQSVRRGALLARIEAVPLQDARLSAASAVRSAQHQLELARLEAERTRELVAAGALALRDFDRALAAVTQAEAQLADARARLANAETELAHAVLHAPFDGIVSRRTVNRGDVVTPGAELFTIIDPRSMILEASVPSGELWALRVGAPVPFTVRGYPEPFTGRIDRISPAADEATRQVPIFVSLPNADGRLVSGLFAEGRVVANQAVGLVVPTDAVNTSSTPPWVLRVTNGRAEKIHVQLGLQDALTERVQISGGIDEGDQLLRGPAQAITPGTPVQVITPDTPAHVNDTR
jgi:RND family efflux transporter MFP subunit